MPHLLITVCTYNEVDNVRLLLPALRAVAPDADILVIDDSSPDGTAAAVRELQKDDSRIDLIVRPGKLGLGSAVLTGFRKAIEGHYDLVICLDADFSHDPKYIPDLLSCMDRCDVAIGSRYVDGGGSVDWNWRRRLISRSINFYARLLLGLKTQDNSGSYRCYRVNKLAEIDWDRVVCSGYGFLEEVLYRCRQAGATFAETPIVFQNRRFGETKINWKEAVGALTAILKLAGERFRGISVLRPDHRPQHREQDRDDRPVS